MATGLVIYYSRTGNTKQMAEIIAGSMNDAGLTTQCKSVEEVNNGDLVNADAIVVGSPCYYGHMAGEIASFFDETCPVADIFEIQRDDFCMLIFGD